jgi:hypothetical protein
MLVINIHRKFYEDVNGLFSNACNTRTAKTVDRLRMTTTVHLVITVYEIMPFWTPLLIQQK